LVVVCAIISPTTAMAQRADCGGVRDWHAGIDAIRLDLSEREANAMANGVPMEAAAYASAAREARALETPADAESASDSLVTGWEGIAEYLDAIVAQREALGQGTGLTYESQESLAYAVSDARSQSLAGYLGWSALGATCGAYEADDFSISADTDDCASVGNVFGRVAAAYEAYWIYWEEAYVMDRRRKSRYPGSEWLEQNRDGTYSLNIPSNDWGEVVAPSEMLSAYAYTHALQLATMPVLPASLDLQEAAVASFQGWSDLYLVSMMAAFGGLLGLDEAGFEELFALHTRLSEQAIAGYADLERDWEAHATQCGVNLDFPGLPGS
jgi:hypothetical protein